MIKVRRVGLYEATQISLEAEMTKQGVSKKLIDELMTSVNRVNYGQDCQLNALAGMVGLSGAGSDLRIVQGGFQQVRSSHDLRDDLVLFGRFLRGS